MQTSFTPEQEQLREQLREYFAGLMTAELRDALASSSGEYGNGAAYKQVVRQLGKDGWLAIGWPAEYGGQDRAVLDQLVFKDEAADSGVPGSLFTNYNGGARVIGDWSPQQYKCLLT